VQTLALSFQDSATRANDCDGLARACTGAARELRAARDLIKGYEQHIAAADERIEAAKKEIESLRELGGLFEERAEKLGGVIIAERAAKDALLELKEEQEKRIAKLEGQLKRTRKLTLILGVAASVGILIGIAK
jgi:septal ring factor EnvC (AmiA/AmiB activator)